MSMTESPSKIDHTFLVAEYQALRDEIIKRLEIQQQLHLFALVAFGTFLTIGFQSKTVTIPLLYPILALFLASCGVCTI